MARVFSSFKASAHAEQSTILAFRTPIMAATKKRCGNDFPSRDIIRSLVQSRGWASALDRANNALETPLEMKVCPKRQVTSLSADLELLNATGARLRTTRLNKTHTPKPL